MEDILDALPPELPPELLLLLELLLLELPEWLPPLCELPPDECGIFLSPYPLLYFFIGYHMKTGIITISPVLTRVGIFITEHLNILYSNL